MTAQVQPRTLTHTEFLAEAKERFGGDTLDIAFQCPACGDVASLRDFPADRRERAGQECIGRTLGALDTIGYDGRGCCWTAYGLIGGPWTVTMTDGRAVSSFPFAEATP